MENRALIRAFRLMAQLLELHDENPFKVRAYEGAAAAIDRLEVPLQDLNPAEFTTTGGLGKSAAAVATELLRTGTFPELARLQAETPPGVVEMLGIKGIGPKKIRTIWRELGVESIDALREAAEQDRVSQLKGFGQKTQEAILQALEFTAQSRGKLLLPHAQQLAAQLIELLKTALRTEQVAASGEVRRALPVVETVRVVAATTQAWQAHDALNATEGLVADDAHSGPFAWRGTAEASGVKVEVQLAKPEDFVSCLFLTTGADAHLAAPLGDKAPAATLRELVRRTKFFSEEAIYQTAGLDYIAPEMREGAGEVQEAQQHQLPLLLEETDLRGSLHNHSTYSDGAHSLRQMAEFLRDNGYQYLGICDHSRAAHYAGGLSIDEVRKQHREIDQLNKELAPFRIFKGIESDILSDGSLDYPDDVLAEFDFIVASVHSGLKMDQERATERLLRAIANPFCTMLGHPTGRLLLRREGYPIDFKAVIDACAEHNVVIEINSNPWRLDLDWQWVRYALQQGVKLSINPDAHHTDGYADMRFGVLQGRKGGLTAATTLNALTVDEIDAFFQQRRQQAVKFSGKTAAKKPVDLGPLFS
ncbi:DNA polymerase/3'-5' exonuclease PolX [Hymenobacter busanensis]|uniref:DNA polymerase/3'-5' exonuclease PolX n=1 Tax=Hymenobacter busanensis TaxID=2607656 RepID=A0A7L5A4P2_9BACT|nr:DNA polymerase/3'-5' exonuclease PolX [Hymenobacter busanensis]KAA9338393.1 DNA polymerase/3'-5' exonuclease PolX [Hymenobacter busanensis]QHJ09180.1 DNA polymerase/3'-5' exonuclease PolX [Hymenobacter busanensis]